MKRILIVLYFVILLVTLYWFFPIPDQNKRNGFAKADLAETQTAVLAQVWNLLRFSPFANEVTTYFTNKTNLSSFNGFVFMSYKLVPQVWGKSLASRSIANVWFFVAMMIISLFYCFYRCSKTDQESVTLFLNNINIFNKLE